MHSLSFVSRVPFAPDQFATRTFVETYNSTLRYFCTAVTLNDTLSAMDLDDSVYDSSNIFRRVSDIWIVIYAWQLFADNL